MAVDSLLIMNITLKDIESRNDIEAMLRSFYASAFEDELIGHFFTEVVPLDLRTHIPVITDFWEAIVFNTHAYQKCNGGSQTY